MIGVTCALCALQGLLYLVLNWGVTKLWGLLYWFFGAAIAATGLLALSKNDGMLAAVYVGLNGFWAMVLLVLLIWNIWVLVSILMGDYYHLTVFFWGRIICGWILDVLLIGSHTLSIIVGLKLRESLKKTGMQPQSAV